MTLAGDLFLLLGAAFAGLGALGLIRMPDVYNRLQAGTKSVTLGTMAILIGIGLHHPDWWSNLLMVAILAAGLFSALRWVTLDFFPEFNIDTITVSVSYRGATPREVEESIVSRIEEAVWDMALLDYDFFLFTETGTDQDCLLSAHDGQRHLQCVDGPAPESDWVDVVVESGAPALSVSEAISRLDEGSEPFVFFQNRTTSRGNVLYRRYDGHYGLITPADSPDE